MKLEFGFDLSEPVFKTGDILIISTEDNSIESFLTTELSEDIIMVDLKTCTGFVYSDWEESFGKSTVIRIIPFEEIVITKESII